MFFRRSLRALRTSVFLLPLFPLCLFTAVCAQPIQKTINWDDALDQETAWYATTEAVRIADNVLAYQDKSGGWPKNIDMAQVLSESDRNRIRKEQAERRGTPDNITIDNGATHTQMRYLARVYNHTSIDRFKESFLLGVDYLLEAQYDNGGWPQYYPLREGYYEQITFNDGAMIGVLDMLQDLSSGHPDFTFMDSSRRSHIEAALARGIESILRMQIRQDGKRTAWCAQHDKNTMEPAWARAYEPPSLSGGESVGIVRFLMSIEEPTPEIISAIEGAVSWFQDVAIHGLRYERFTDEQGNQDRRVVTDPEAPLLWARFYELDTNKPIFLGRDSVVRYALEDIEQERRSGYSYYGSWARDLLEKEYPLWKAKHHLSGGALDGNRHRVIVSTDIGGTDPDDFQSMVHLLLYADVLDIEGLISSPFGPGRKKHILEVIDHYERDFSVLQHSSDAYPTPDELRARTKQGAIDRASYRGVGEPSEGSAWIIDRALANDPRPLYVLVWGGLEDLAQALHDAPNILPKLRVYWIGGPNKKWSPDAYQYIADNHPELWMIEANATYRGWFVGGNQTGQWGNAGFVEEHVAGNGSLGSFFNTQLGGTIKMGDTPSVGWLLKGTPEDPSKPGWGGQFVRTWDLPNVRFNRMTTEADSMQEFGILELVLPISDTSLESAEAYLEVTNQSLPGYIDSDGSVRFRFSPKAAGSYTFKINSNIPELDGTSGAITAYTPSPDVARHPTTTHPNWWTDDPSVHLSENGHIGVKTVSQWREDFLQDFAARMKRVVPTTTSAQESPSPLLEAETPGYLRDISYAPADPENSRGHLLDLYLPANASEPAPIVIFTGGSAWFSDNTKEAAKRIAPPLLDAGFAVAGVSIRSSPQATFPAQVHDIKAAIRWLRKNASAHNLDPNNIGIMGDSSGGWTSAMAAVTGDVPALEGDIGVTGISSEVQVAIAFYPPTNFLEMDTWATRPCKPEMNMQEGFRTGQFCHDDPRSPESSLIGCPIQECQDKTLLADPVRYISPEDPPIMILHGQSDLLVPHHQGERLYMALNKACNDAVFVSLPLAGHGPVRSFLEKDDVRSGATLRTTKSDRCEVTHPQLITPEWTLVLDFLSAHLHK